MLFTVLNFQKQLRPQALSAIHKRKYCLVEVLGGGFLVHLGPDVTLQRLKFGEEMMVHTGPRISFAR